MPDISVTGVHRGTIQMDHNFAVAADTVATQSDPDPDLEFTDVPIYNFVIEHP